MQYRLRDRSVESSKPSLPPSLPHLDMDVVEEVIVFELPEGSLALGGNEMAWREGGREGGREGDWQGVLGGSGECWKPKEGVRKGGKERGMR